QCPDGKSQCPDGTTCCQTTTGSYGCCPFTDAVCCTDHLHCCPGGTTCDLEHSVCKSATKETPLWTKLPAVLRDVGFVCVSSVTCPDGRSKCPDETTCCLLSNGSYGCCPLPNAECCSDFVHCCPKGYTCNVEASSCEQKSLVFPWLSQRPLTLVKAPMSRVPVRASDVPCDDTTSCPDGSTCCKTTQGGWACCPSAKAVCCEDHVHCCPEGTTCDVAAGTCDSSTASVPWLKKVPAVSRVPVGARDIPCDDTTSCPDGSTCCKTTQGGWACCPLVPVGARDIPCDDTTSCPDGSTCCKTTQGGWACCPLAKAVCCEDHVHCCPEGTTCDVAAGTCDSSTASVPWLKKVPAVSRVPVGARDIPCDDTTSCPDGSTCCKTTQGGWACCPLAKAVCCEDHVHCCPEGTTCDVAAGTCDSSTASVPWLKKVPAVSRVPVGARDIPCDDTTSCPDGSTCCKTTQGGWACCPLAKAVCCEDHVHCCPEGTTCDVAAGTCDSSTASVPWLKKVPAVSRVPVGARDIPCDDTTSCPDGSTCCKTTQGGWACCPLAKAVCCEDHVHCCPEGTTCDVAAGTCDSSTASVPWLKKVPAVSRVPVGARDIPCDDTTSCPDGSTCCKTTQGGWACCPLAKAVCCEDHVHCCPEGTTCDVAAGTCDSSTASVPWLKKVPAVSRVPVGARDIPCDDTTSCPDGSTCCKTTQGGWACCPLAKAVCCEDHVHCCPEGTTCDVAAGMCDSSTASVPWLKKVPAVSRVPKDEKCDNHTSCPRSTTCCQQSPGKWACCPLPHAVCCEDGEHCCPRGYRCDVTKTSCIKEGQEIPWSRKLKASSTPAGPQDVRCDPQTSCASGTTCCQLPTGKWGCCPLVKAVCCSDHEHCCPQGYRCNIEAGTCEKQGEPFVWLTHTAPLVRVSGLAAQSSQLQRDIKCSDTFQCSDGETCCQITAHSWACCPFPQVC
ncbi:GRN protein, partial [Amia calva]|nr:GRN protein [Amia calva]